MKLLTSMLVPIFIEASNLYIQGHRAEETLVLRPEIRASLSVLQEHNVESKDLKEVVSNNKRLWPLRDDDAYDLWRTDVRREAPLMAVHASRLKVAEESDDWLKDDIYVYFFITDGTIPTGKVTSTYKGLSAGETFHFNEADRQLYPLSGEHTRRPQNHLIIDYGIIESDGDDIKQLQKLTGIIIDLAIAVYASYDPGQAPQIMNLRKEVQALAEWLTDLDHDDRLATGTFAFQVSELGERFQDKTYFEVSKKHVSRAEFNSWEYKLTLRFLRANVVLLPD